MERWNENMKYYEKENMNYEELAVVGERIRNLRKKKGYSQMVFAELVRMSKNSISNIELGQQRFMSSKLQKFAEVLGVTTDYILMGVREENRVERELLEEIMKMNLREKKKWLVCIRDIYCFLLRRYIL